MKFFHPLLHDNFTRSDMNAAIKLFREKFDLIIDLQNSKRTSFYNLLFRIFQSGKICSSRPFSHIRYNIPNQGDETVRSGLLNQLKLLGITKNTPMSYSWLETELKEKNIKPIALIIPGVSNRGRFGSWGALSCWTRYS